MYNQQLLNLHNINMVRQEFHEIGQIDALPILLGKAKAWSEHFDDLSLERFSKAFVPCTKFVDVKLVLVTAEYFGF